jgi:hypothetical protein
MNYRTVISLGEKNIKFLMGNFTKLLEGPNKDGIKEAHRSGFLFGYSVFVRFAFIAFIFYVGTVLIVKKHLGQ